MLNSVSCIVECWNMPFKMLNGSWTLLNTHSTYVEQHVRILARTLKWRKRGNVIIALRCKRCRCNYETSKKRRKNRKTWTSFGAYYTLLAELRNHELRSRVGLPTHINTFSKFHSHTAAVSVAMLDLFTKPRDTKLENDWWTSFNKRQLVEWNDCDYNGYSKIWWDT